MKVLAYAKLNLALRVVGRREDGLHAIESFVQTVDLADRLTVERREEGVTVENSLALPPSEDLAARAATLLLQEKGDPCGAEITVEKRIPAGAGLGGGSSDAAAVLAALDRLTPPRLPRTRLADLAKRLGADVSLFLTGGRLRMEGAGERVMRLPFGGNEQFVVLVPPVHSVTSLVYARFDRLIPGPAAPREALELGANDLEEAAVELYPDLLPYRRGVRALGADFAGMSGSGSAFFAAFIKRESAAPAARELERAFPQAQVFLCGPTRCGSAVEGDIDADCD
jgi:4-diphosphocytidyl-2-C-methyl-D-erythritol kinase